MGRPSAQSDGNAGSRSPHAVINVLVRTHPSAAGAMGRTVMGDPVLHLQGQGRLCAVWTPHGSGGEVPDGSGE